MVEKSGSVEEKRAEGSTLEGRAEPVPMNIGVASAPWMQAAMTLIAIRAGIAWPSSFSAFRPSGRYSDRDARSVAIWASWSIVRIEGPPNSFEPLITETAQVPFLKKIPYSGPSRGMT